MSLQDIVIMMHNGEYGRAISSLEHEAKDASRPPLERAEYCKWLAECYTRLDELKEAGDWYLEAIKMILSERMDSVSKAKVALPLCDKALDCYKQGGDSADVLVAGRLKQHLLSLSKQAS